MRRAGLIGPTSEIEDQPAVEAKPKLASNGDIKRSCSFCGKDQDEVSTLIIDDKDGGHVAICNECVGVCVKIIAEKESAAKAAPPADDGLGIPNCLRR